MTTKRRAKKPPREYKLRLPHDLATEIEDEADRSEVPQTKVIIERLIREKTMNGIQVLDELIEKLINANGEAGTLLTRYGAQVDSLDLSEELLRIVDEILTATQGELPARLDRLRLVRGKMLELERSERERATFTKVVREAEKRTKKE